MNIKEAIAAMPVVNVQRAINFYENILGFKSELLSEDLGMYWILAPNSRFLLYLREEKSKALHTTLSFSVENIALAIKELEGHGVKFFQKGGKKVFDLDGSLSAWFQDSEGNNLEISQRPDYATYNN